MYCKTLILAFLVLTGSLWAGAQQATLDYFLTSALQNSPLLKDYGYQQRANAIDSSRIAASYRPQVFASSLNSYAPVVHGFGYDGAITNFGNFSELITVSKQLVSRPNLQNQYGALRLANDSLSLASRISEQDIRREVTAQFISAYGSWQQYLYNKEIYTLLAGEDTLLRTLTQANVYRQTDYLTFLVTLKQQQLAVTQARTQYHQDYGMLNYLCGLVDTSFTELKEPLLGPDSLIAGEQSVYYRKFLLDSLLLENQHARIDFDYRPKVSLYADAGLVTSLQYEPYKNFGTSVGISVQVPIYDGHQRKMLHNKVNLAEETRRWYRDFFRNQYTQQVAQLLQQVRLASEAIDQAADQLKYSRGLIDANGKLLATGDLRIADYILAINNYLQLRNVLTINTINRWQLINQLNYWNQP
ncbi:MAG TPA: TolC family protein [Chitinophagaceae bacterium]|nr:TolC family protein [Chitinophagaceae bacterium]